MGKCLNVPQLSVVVKVMTQVIVTGFYLLKCISCFGFWGHMPVQCVSECACSL